MSVDVDSSTCVDSMDHSASQNDPEPLGVMNRMPWQVLLLACMLPTPGQSYPISSVIPMGRVAEGEEIVKDADREGL